MGRGDLRHQEVLNVSHANPSTKTAARKNPAYRVQLKKTAPAENKKTGLRDAVPCHTARGLVFIMHKTERYESDRRLQQFLLLL